MKRLISLLVALSMILSVVFSLGSCEQIFKDDGIIDPGGSLADCVDGNHVDENDDDSCDICGQSVLVIIDFYAINDLHGKFCDTSGQPGVDEIGTYIDKMEELDDNIILLSSGDMWQGSAESNLSRGKIITEWMNELGFVGMTLGNHEFDWGEDAIRENLEIAEFPFLAINIYDTETGKLADYCTPSVTVECDGIEIGIIGAIGDCYSSISSDKVAGVEFKVGFDLAQLVREEAERLRSEGVDYVVYSLHDGHGSSSSGNNVISTTDLQKYYTPSLSNGTIDLVFEGHSHQGYTLVDSYGVYHVQARGENKALAHVEIAVNSVNGNNRVTSANLVDSSVYSNLSDHEETENLEDKYSGIIDMSYSVLGQASKYYDDAVLEDKVAELYLKAGEKRWSDYNIVLGGGFLKTRSPYNLYKGDVTYAMLMSLLPFDNEIVLCSISGRDLKSRFINNNNSDYHIYISEYGEDILNSISDNRTYYVVVDSYTALYAYNRLTIVEYYDYKTYARDLVAEAIKKGEL